MFVRGNELRRSAERWLMPPGGGLLVTQEGFVQLAHAFGEEEEAFAARFSAFPDLRFSLELSQLVAFRNWYTPGCRGIELRPLAREFYEEFVEERELLTPQEAEATLTLARSCVELQGPSIRHETRGQRTFYFVDLVSVVLPTEALTRLVETSGMRAMHEFVTRREVLAGQSTSAWVDQFYRYIFDAFD
jgi:hypothetical protein